jgi:hypothetical protein
MQFALMIYHTPEEFARRMGAIGIELIFADDLQHAPVT